MTQGDALDLPAVGPLRRTTAIGLESALTPCLGYGTTPRLRNRIPPFD